MTLVTYRHKTEGFTVRVTAYHGEKVFYLISDTRLGRASRLVTANRDQFERSMQNGKYELMEEKA